MSLCDAEFGGLFDGPLEVVELEDGEVADEGEGRTSDSSSSCRVKWTSAGGIELDEGDLGAVQEAAGDDIEDLPGLGSQDAREMGGLLADEGRREVGVASVSAMNLSAGP